MMQPRQTEVFLHPGEFHFGPAPERIGTLLGSCVAVTVWHPQYRFGGMSHILLPARRRPPGSLPDCRYANEAIERFFYELKAKRVDPGSCQVKLFGGGNMFGTAREGLTDVGRRNIDATRRALAAYGFTVMSEHVGGQNRRRLFLDLTSGHTSIILPQNNHHTPKESP